MHLHFICHILLAATITGPVIEASTLKGIFFKSFKQNLLFMKQTIVMICLAIFMASCNNPTTTNSSNNPATVAAKPGSEVVLPYKLEKPYQNWQIGSTENAAAAMNSLKTFQDNDFVAFAATLGDSVEIRLDYYYAKLNRDSAVNFFKSFRPTFNDLSITMYDYESVISADKKEEWVTLWYKQVWKDDKGKADSLNIIDDCKMQNGKLIVMDEKIQHYPVKK